MSCRCDRIRVIDLCGGSQTSPGPRTTSIVTAPLITAGLCRGRKARSRITSIETCARREPRIAWRSQPFADQTTTLREWIR